MTTTIQNLDGSAWTFRARASDPAIIGTHAEVLEWMPARVPGSTYGQLLALGRIPDPYYGRNELDLQWVDRLDWEWRRELNVDAAVCARTRQELIFDGLDTIATILLNGREVGRSVNMFRRLVCDVRGVLTPGRNELIVRVASPTGYSAAQASAHAGHPANDPAMAVDSGFVWQTGEQRTTNRPWIRKTQCHFGWDWGVCLPTQGVWLSCRLECSDAPRIDAVTVDQRHHGPTGAPTHVDLEIGVRLAHPVDTTGRLTLSCDGQCVEVPVSVTAGVGRATATITIRDPRLWWPNGAGAQPLYELTVAWDAEAPVRRRIGLRTCELVTKSDTRHDGKPGEGMLFRINGRDLYMKGGDWIPVDQMIEGCTPRVYRHLLTSMAEAHMNMVRVWGGGWYELDVFYDLCDELGLLVWQDFMMACAPFPGTPDFVTEVTAEAVDQIRRLQHRACIALWCGDNECLAGLPHWCRRVPDEAANLRANYAAIMTALRDTVQEEDPTRRFWVSSPSNGWIDDNPDAHDRGDVHYWNVWHGQAPFENYLTVRPRFASEFGFQSFAEPRTMRDCVPTHDMNPSSWHMEHHQRSADGNQRITNTIARELPIPRDFDAYCWESQINQANAIRTAVEHWRRCKPWCMGTLYWQVNDLWPVASWSSIDYHGRWKALHHAAKRFFAPLLVSTHHDRRDGTVHIWATSDLARPLHLEGFIDAVAWDGQSVARIPLAVDLPADGNAEVARIPVANLLNGRHPREVCCFVELAGDGESATNHATLVPWKHVPLPRPVFSANLGAADGGLVLELACDTVAPFVHAELVGTESHFDCSFDVLRPGRTYRWRLVEHHGRGQAPISLAEGRKNLRIFTLADLAWSEDRKTNAVIS